MVIPPQKFKDKQTRVSARDCVSLVILKTSKKASYFSGFLTFLAIILVGKHMIRHFLPRLFGIVNHILD